MRSTWALALAASGLFSTSIAQTFTSCDPTKKTCPPDKGLNSATSFTDFTNGAADGWTVAEGTTMTYGNNGAVFSIATGSQAPLITFDSFFLFGTVEVVLQAAPGMGIVSSIVLESDDLDEIDFEMVGGGTWMNDVETNFFGKGNTSAYDRATYVPQTQSLQTNFVTYKFDWNADRIIWSVDGNVIRTLQYTDPLTWGGSQYPQTPMQLRLGSWAAGGPNQPDGTVLWAGCQNTCTDTDSYRTDFSQGPFNMYVKSVSITNNNPASSYTYSDTSGSYESIVLGNGDHVSAGSSPSATSSQPANAQPSGVVSANGQPFVGSGIPQHRPTATANATDSVPTTLSYANKAQSTIASNATEAIATAIDTGSVASATPSVESSSSDASINKITMASIGIFTLAMCFWML